MAGAAEVAAIIATCTDPAMTFPRPLSSNRGTRKPGRVWNRSGKSGAGGWGSDTTEFPLVANGESSIDFSVGLQPGNNYRLVASLIDNSMIADVQTDDPALPGYLGPELAQDGGTPASPPLTVWRRLWVENDSMKKIPVDDLGFKKNALTSDIADPRMSPYFWDSTANSTEFEINEISDISSFLDLEHGRIVFQSISHPVIGTRYDVTTGFFFASVSENHSAVPAGSVYRLFDDDDFGLNRDALPRMDLIDDVVKDVYKTAFIDIVDASDYNEHKEIDFYRNAPEFVGALQLSYGVWDDSIDSKLGGNENLWCATVIAGYQGKIGEDGDPSEEGPATEGITPVRMVGRAPFTNDEARYSIVWVENVRDVLDTNLRGTSPLDQKEIDRRIRLTAAHEIGHQPHYMLGEAQHLELGLMQEGGDDSLGGAGYNSNFTAKSVNRFRTVHKWREE